MKYLKSLFCIILFCFLYSVVIAQKASNKIEWLENGTSYLYYEGNQIIKNNLIDNSKSVVVSSQQLTPKGSTQPIAVKSYAFSSDGDKVLIFTNSKKVWRLATRGDYWLLDLKTNTLNQVGKDFPVSSLMFAKISPDGNKVAFVSEYNIYVEDVATGATKQMTFDGNRKLINGTFDWAYEEEFFCRDGFRWSPDSKKIAYWQIDARKTKDYLMINNTDSIYPFIVPVEYPIAGEHPSPYKIGVVDISTANTKWMNVPTDPVLGSYVPRMEWAANNTALIIQHLNRKQNTSQIMLCEVETGSSKTIYVEKDNAWIDILPMWDDDYIWGGWDWLNDGKEFVWVSEKDGWRHLYRVSRDGKKETLITKGDYDVMEIATIDEKSGYVYFFASPDNATQKYLYRTKLDGTGRPERVTPSNQPGTHDYIVSPTGQFAYHTFSNHYTKPVSEWISLPNHKSLNKTDNVEEALAKAKKSESSIEFFKIKTEEGIEMDAWMMKPVPFNPSKKYPVVFYVYTEPGGQNVKDVYNVTRNRLYNGDMANDGYIYVSIDNRGTLVAKGRDWRKIVYRKIGLANIRDQALAAKEVLKMPFVDKDRVAVWGWSGGGSATLNLMFQYPEIYKTGIAVAALGNQLTYDNIYQERYMGLPQENMEDFIKGSPITYAKNLKGNLLYIHGTGDDNVHYNNSEMLINELVKYNKQFHLMSYPNRSHGLSEGEGTFTHLTTLFTNYLKQYCPPGGR